MTFIPGTGFSVLVTVKEANLAPLYAPADHSLSNDNSYFRGDSLIVQRYCPYPVPEKYQLSVTLHHVRCTLVLCHFFAADSLPTVLWILGMGDT